MKILRRIASVFLASVLMSVALFPVASFSNTIYKDITSISIKTKFNLDYETIKEEGVEDIQIADLAPDGDSSDDWNIATQSTKYYIESAEWYDSDAEEFGIGGQPRVCVYLATKDCDQGSGDRDYYYRFLSSYSSSSCYVGSGTFVSAQRQSTDLIKIVFKLKPLKGTYDQPEDAFWADDKGTAQWYPPTVNDSGYYDLVLYRDSSTVARVDAYHGTAYNFYQYMTKPGDYMYKIRTVGGGGANQTAYGKNSEYIESTSLVISEYDVYDPSKGAYNYDTGTSYIPGSYVTNPSQIGWIEQNNKWYFVRPDGQMVKNGWIEWNNKWYFLTSDGTMATGWIEHNGYEYFLQSDGAMLTGWLSSANTYFYLNDRQGQKYGAMCKDEFVTYNGKYFYFDENGMMVTGWRQIKDVNGNVGFYYFYQNGEVNGLYGYMATNTNINGFNIGADGRWTQS